ncbi:hypothetical protein AVEN_244458-1 [Araneus ventricosus]|uniref:Uncharacterized protein n=1 Tax=Araneus ventricosus TaxID=182803 RepID=A0A4Y2PNH0_ARAVE|nr:hypothetical protein AVEN_244458-1 [Araneus ventricosus]
MTSMSVFCDAEEKFSCEMSPHIAEDINFNYLEFDCINLINVESADNEDNDTNQNYDVKVNLENLNEPLYPSSSIDAEIERMFPDAGNFLGVFPSYYALRIVKYDSNCRPDLTRRFSGEVDGMTE